MEPLTCKDCKFFDPNSTMISKRELESLGDNDAGACLRYPPVLNPVVIGLDVSLGKESAATERPGGTNPWVVPIVLPDFFCGEFVQELG